MQQQDQSVPHTYIRPIRLIKHPHNFLSTDKWRKYDKQNALDVAVLPTKRMRSAHPSLQMSSLPNTPRLDLDEPEDVFDVSLLSTAHLLQLSGRMRAMNAQTGPLPLVNVYRQEFPSQPLPYVPELALPPSVQPKRKWRAILSSPTARIVISFIVGVVLLFLTIRAINVEDTIKTIIKYLLTPLGITYALLAGLAFIASFSIRGVRWKLFLNPVGRVSTLKAMQLFWVGVFINFLLPVRGGEVAKSLMLKRIANIPISQSLPTVAMDKALDLLPALVIMAVVPLLPGVHMTPQLWFVLSVVAGILIGLIFFIALAAWKRTAAIALMHRCTSLLPGKIGGGIEGFATGFVDSLLAGASQPKIFLPALLLTIVAVFFDGLFAMLAFWAVGLSMPFGMAIFGYTIYNMFCILPNAPAGVGTNEATGGIVFVGLLNYNSSNIEAMFAFSHPWTTLLMAAIAMLSLSSLGLTISSAMKLQSEEKTPQQVQQRPAKSQAC